MTRLCLSLPSSLSALIPFCLLLYCPLILPHLVLIKMCSLILLYSFLPALSLFFCSLEPLLLSLFPSLLPPPYMFASRSTCGRYRATLKPRLILKFLKTSTMHVKRELSSSANVLLHPEIAIYIKAFLILALDFSISSIFN